MPDITFHSMADSAYLWTAMHVADEKGVSYDLRPLILGSPEHLKLHPFGKMPVMQHGDFYLYETVAIAHYIDRAFDGPSLQPSTVRGEADVFRWMSIVNAYVFPFMNRFVKERLVRPAWGIEPDRAFIASARLPLMLQMRVIDEACSASTFLVGDTVTIADSFLLPHLLFFQRTPEGEWLLEQSPAASAWLARMMERPSFSSSSMSVAYHAFHELAPQQTELAWPIDQRLQGARCGG